MKIHGNAMLRRHSALSTVLLVCALSGVSHAQTVSSPGAVIARAGDIFVSEREFLERYEMLPAFGRHRRSQTETAKLELLYSIIAEKLLAQDAAAKGLDTSFPVRRGAAEIAKLLARDELYREEVLQKSGVSKKELERGLAASQIELLLRYVFFTREEDAQFIRKQMRRFDDFEGLRIDSSFHAVRDTATLIWGDADPGIEAAAYRLKRGEISPVTKAGSGWYVFTVSSVRKNFAYASMASDVLRDRVMQTLRRRKEHARLDEFAAAELRGGTGYAVARSLRVLASALTQVYREAAHDSVVYLTADRAAALERICAPSLQDTIAVAGDQFWSIGDVIGRLMRQGFGVVRTALPSIPVRLDAELMGLVQRELMAQRALRRGLDTIATVRRQVEMWRESLLALSERDAIRGGVTVSDPEVWAYLKWQDSSIVVPQVQIRELRTRSFEEMQGALDDLQHGMSLGEVVRKWSVDPSARSSGGLSSYFPVTERAPIGGIATRLALGERYGPLAVRGGVVYFELTGRKSAPVDRDSSTAIRFAKAREEVTEKKGRRAITLSLAGLGKEKGVDVYFDRLKMLDVTTIPMMTYRILGFGGRMLAVPFVVPELDWLDVNEPDQRIQP
jgi:parvulin-like peptidyl-prolyl isomerase